MNINDIIEIMNSYIGEYKIAVEILRAMNDLWRKYGKDSPEKDGRYLIRVKRRQCPLQKSYLRIEIAKYKEGCFVTDDIFEHRIE